jgi:2-methylcitrate dehydratase PrpD
LQSAYAAKNGVIAAVLAGQGISGCHNFITGEYGFWTLYRDHEKPFDRDLGAETFLQNLGNEYKVEELSIKPYPCCRSNHPGISGVLELVRKYGITPSAVRSLTIYLSESTFERVGGPFRIRSNPQVDAQFNASYTAAVALTKGDVVLRDFESERVISQVDIQELAKRITVKLDPALDQLSGTIVEADIDGQAVSHVVNMVKGSPEDPLTEDELKRKFIDCLTYSRKFNQGESEKVFETVLDLEEIPTISEITRLLRA